MVVHRWDTLLTHLNGKNILKDLDYKASDLLLSNGIIWVEGPSDVIYIELFLQLYKIKLNGERKLNYCIQSLSTALWKYAGFTDFDWDKIDETLDNRIVSLAKLNHNNLLVIDKDDNYEEKKPSDYSFFTNGTGRNKAKLINEVMAYSGHDENELETFFGDAKTDILFFWINDKTIETYLRYFITTKGNTFEKYFNVGDDTSFAKRDKGENSSISKVELAAEIATFVLENGHTFDEIAPENSSLANKIRRLYITIQTWN
jgi:hypothetical protein